jgi:hypothetical protein
MKIRIRVFTVMFDTSNVKVCFNGIRKVWKKKWLVFYCGVVSFVPVVVVADFASASTVYDTVNGSPVVVWNANAVPANGNEPANIGSSVCLVIRAIAIFCPGANGFGAFNGSPND